MIGDKDLASITCWIKTDDSFRWWTLANSDLNVLYKHIINENNKHLIKINNIKSNNINEFNSYIEDLISLHESKSDDLIDNSSDVNNSNKYNTTTMKSLVEMLKGKWGRFRHKIFR